MPVSADVESLIADAPLSAHLATSVDDRPHVAPVWYGYRDGVLYFITGGRKLSNVRRNPRVAVSIEQATDGDVEWNVTLRGTATVRDDPDRIDWASGWIYDKYDDGTGDDGSSDDDGSGDDERVGDGNDVGVSDDEGSDDERSGVEGSDAEGSDAEGSGDEGENSGEQRGAALVEVEIGSGSANVYE